jgi:hypothetical protein
MIRRELPLTTDASPVEPVANVRRGFSFVLAPAAADPVLDLDNVVHELFGFCFFLLRKVFAFVLSGPGHAAICCLQAASALIPMAQMKPSSSRAITVMLEFDFLNGSHRIFPSSLLLFQIYCRGVSVSGTSIQRGGLGVFVDEWVPLSFSQISNSCCERSRRPSLR